MICSEAMLFDFEVQVQCVCFLYRNFISLTSLGINWTSPWPQFLCPLEIGRPELEWQTCFGKGW